MAGVTATRSCYAQRLVITCSHLPSLQPRIMAATSACFSITTPHKTMDRTTQPQPACPRWAEVPTYLGPYVIDQTMSHNSSFHGFVEVVAFRSHDLKQHHACRGLDISPPHCSSVSSGLERFPTFHRSSLPGWRQLGIRIESPIALRPGQGSELFGPAGHQCGSE